MTDALLQTKLNIPQIHPNIVARSRLIERLNLGLQTGVKLILVSAPAGFGKTTLVVDWLSNLKSETTLPNYHQPLWISLDENDNDHFRFFSYLNESLQSIDHTGTAMRTLLHSPQQSVESMASTLINDVMAVTDPIILVLEDYHFISSETIHQSLAFLLNHLPNQLQIVITSRADPLLPLPRLRARGQLVEIRTDDLRFSTEEAASFLTQIMGLRLSADEILALEERTEGWIAGLQMAALSLQDIDDPDQIKAFVAKFAGTHRYIFDYLTDEVLRQRPPGTRDFLLHTSILDRFCAPLCDAVLSEEYPDLDSQKYLEQLESANLFVQPLDEGRKWYRYHHLFAQLLRLRLSRAQPDRITVLQERASRWYEEQGDIKAAIKYSLAAGDRGRAAKLLDSIALSFINRAEIRELLSWIELIPEEKQKKEVRLNMAHAWAQMFAHNYEAVIPILDIAQGHLDQPESLPPDLPPAHLAASIATVQAYMATRSGRLEEAITLSEKALLLLEGDISSPAPDLRGPITLNLGLTYRQLDQVDLAANNFYKALEFNRLAGRGFAALATYGTLIQLNMVRGELAAAKRIGEEGLAWSASFADKLGYPLPAEAEIRREMARLYYQLNELDAAREHQIKGLDLILWGSPTVAAELYDLAFYWHLAIGDVSGALVCLDECKGLVYSAFRADEEKEAAREADRQLALWRMDGCPPETFAETKSWARAQSFSPDDSVTFQQEYGYAVYARLLLAEGQASQALGIASQLSNLAKTAGRFGDQIRYLLISARALKRLNLPDEAVKILKEAVRLAQPGGHIRVFVDGGSEISSLLKQVNGFGLENDDDKRQVADFVSQLLDVLEKDGHTAVKVTEQPLSDQLSRRELDVLALLSSHLTGPEIAQELYISVNTYKTHSKNIYGKLQVNSRREAVNRAKELGLV